MAVDEILTDQVRQRALELGFDLIGVASALPFAPEQELVLESLTHGRMLGMAWITPDRVRLSCNPEALLPGSRSIVALGTSYATRSATTLPGEPHPSPGPTDGHPTPELLGRVARYAWGRDYHQVIPPKLRALADTIVDLAGAATRCRTFVDTGPLLDRAAAARAGIGFIGKNTCLLTGRHGSYVFLSAILTTADLRPDPIVTRDCGSCRACLDACPTDAFVAPRQLDATRCISYLTIEHRGWIPAALRPQMGDWVFGCDVCQDVCPWNRARLPAHHDEFRPEEGAGPTLDLQELLSLDEPTFRARFRHTPLMRTKRRGLLRNAAIALGNLGEQSAILALLGALGDDEPLIRGHAAWALGQLEPLPLPALDAMRTALECEVDDEVQRELEAVLGATRDAVVGSKGEA